MRITEVLRRTTLERPRPTPPRNVDVSSLLFQCPKCGVPVDVVSLVGTDGNDAIVDLAPCAHTVVLSIEL